MINMEKFFDMIAKNYDESEKRFEQTHINTIKNTKKYLNPGDIGLDYGCATGTKAFEIAGDVKEIYGIDISSKMIKLQKERQLNVKLEIWFLYMQLFLMRD